MFDFFYITAIFAEVAKQINESVVRVDLKRSDTDEKNMREMVKFLINRTSDNNHIFMQLTDTGASYHHLKEQNNSYGSAADDELIVPEVKIRCLYDATTDENAVKLIHEGSIDLLDSGFNKTGIDKAAYRKLVAAIEYVPIDSDKTEEQRTEYAYGMPVINLNTHIRAIENSIQAAEFSKSELLSEELDLLHRALTTREFGERYQGMPRLKRSLSVRGTSPSPLNIERSGNKIN